MLVFVTPFKVLFEPHIKRMRKTPDLYMSLDGCVLGPHEIKIGRLAFPILHLRRELPRAETSTPVILPVPPGAVFAGMSPLNPPL